MKYRLAFALALLATPAAAQVPLLTGPQDVAGLNATLNRIIGQVNTITASLTSGGASQPNSILGSTTSSIVIGSASAVNQVVITGGATGVDSSIIAGGLMSDANAGLIIAPKGTGNLVLGSQYNTPIQFGNAPSFVPTNSLVPCPGYINGGKNPVGLSPVVTGYLVFIDYLGKTHWDAAC